MRATRRSATAVVALSLLGSIVLSSCAATDDQQASTAASKSLTIAIQGDVSTYDPWSAASGFNGSLYALNGFYDSLTHLDADGTPQPWLVSAWKAADASHWTLTIRNDVKFSDGTALDANAVVKNLEYSQTAQTPGECNPYISGIKATAPDATTVEITLAQPNANLMVDFGTCAGFIVNPKSLEDPTSLKTTPAGSGPYLLDTKNSVDGQKWVMTRNPSYWSKDSYPFDTITLQLFSEVAAAANAGQSGQVQLIQTVDADTDTSGLAHLSTSVDFRGLFIADAAGKLVKPLGDVRVRQAMQMAIDRDAIVKSIYPSTGELCYSTPFPSGSVGYSDSLASTFPYDPDRAKQLLTEAGYADGFTIKVMSDNSGLTYVQAAAGYLKKIGITLQITDVSADFIKELHSAKWPVSVFNYTIGTNRLQTFVGLTGKDGFWNVRHSVSETATNLITQITSETDETKAKALYEQLAKAFQDDSWFIAPMFVKGNTAYNDKELKITGTQGSPVILLYNIQPA